MWAVTLGDMNQSAISFKAALAKLARDERYAEVVSHGNLSAGIYAPHVTDDQEPHEEDEVYVIVNGSGFFTAGDERHPFGPGDLLFVPAGVEHRFENFTPDFAVWAVFSATAD